MQPGKIWFIFELNTGTHWKINLAYVFWADVPDFISVYENGGQSDYRRLPQDTAGSPDIGVLNWIFHIIGME